MVTSIKNSIPNFITCLNVMCGCIASVLAFYGKLEYAAYFIILAALFDFCDGLFARILKAYSDIGKELDSLADMISFGFAPSVIVFGLMKLSLFGKVNVELAEMSTMQLIIVFSSFLISVFSGLRLAKFNVDTRQSTSFIGLPTPANALIFLSFPFILKEDNQFLINLIGNSYFLLGAIVFACFILVCEIPMFSFKFKNLKWKENKIRFIFVICALGIIPFLGISSIALIILLYVIFSIVNNLINK